MTNSNHISLLLQTSRRPTAKDLARLTGLILAMSCALGPVSRLWTRALYSMIESRRYWHQKLPWTDQAKREVEFWQRSFEEFHGKLLWCVDSDISVVEAWSDASDFAWGGYSTQGERELVAKGNWSVERRLLEVRLRANSEQPGLFCVLCMSHSRVKNVDFVRAIRQLL